MKQPAVLRVHDVTKVPSEEFISGPIRRWALFVGVLACLASFGFARPQGDEDIQDITGKYHFISADDTLAILEEEGKLKGYVDILQNEDESDAVLSYNIIEGSRKKNRVEFRTSKIHRKYYRFTGTVERGRGHEEVDPDYLRLVGTVEIVTVKGDSGEESVERMRMIFKSMGKNEAEEEQ